MPTRTRDTMPQPGRGPVSAPGNHFSSAGRQGNRYTPEAYNEYMRNYYHRLREEYSRNRRRGEGSSNVVKPVPVPKPEVKEEALKIGLVDFYASQNAQEHHTDKYELVQNKPPTPIFRRGNAFYFAIRTDKRNYDPKKDDIKLEFSFGPSPQLVKGTRVLLPVGENDDFVKGKAVWEARIHAKQDSVTTLHVRVPATACVGVWKCEVVTSLRSDSKVTSRYACKENLYILFNPWCREDQVYMKDDLQREEYVLNDVGKVWVGAAKNYHGRPWVFGQFEDSVLPACLYMLELAKVDWTARGNAVKVVRALSATVNNQDQDGVLQGNWSGHYEGGTAPWEWTGSAKILEEYMNSGGDPVKYGQCWVFSGVVVTVCRALGIPCRSLTNFVSAHDTDGTLTIDKVVDEEGDEVGHADSIWNFHVWNDVWMSRPDLPSGYGGWQAIDGTPQEESEAIYQAGPASVNAIRRGEIGLAYDTPFVFSEVNADIVHWKKISDDEPLQKLQTNKYHIGQKIVTKAPNVFDDRGNQDALDITNEYKNPEGTEEERLSILNAARCINLQKQFDIVPPENEDVEFDLIDIDRILIGDSFKIDVKIVNKSDQTRNVYAILSTASVFYTGVVAKPIKKLTKDIKLKPKEEQLLTVTVTSDEYLDKLVEYSMMKIYAIATVRETRQTWAEEDDFAVDKPVIDLKVPDNIKLHHDFPLTVTFKNPLNRPLQDAHFTFEGPGLSKPTVVPFRTVSPLETVQHVEWFTPLRTGERNIVVNFTSSFLVEIIGTKTVQVQE